MHLATASLDLGLQVKSGRVKSGDIRDLVGTLDREKAALGVFITLEPPSRDMLTEAASAGFYESLAWGRKFPRIQIVTIEQLLAGTDVQMPAPFHTFMLERRIQPFRTPTPEQEQLDVDDIFP